MAIRGEIFEVDEPVAGARRSSRGRQGGLGTVATVAAVALLAVGVLTARDIVGVAAPAPVDDESSATPPPALVLDDTGIGDVRLGMTLMEYRHGDPSQPGGGRSSRLVAYDYSHGCLQYESSEASADVVWVWARGNAVVAVGVERGPGSGAGASATPGSLVFGARLGEPLAVVDELPQPWSWDDSRRLRLASRPTDAGAVTLADVDGDGLVDYARTASADDVCDVDPRRSPELQSPATGSATIEGDSLLGVSLGLEADDVTTVDGWFELGSPRRPCRRFGSGHGARAQALDGRVVALSADRLAEGPAVGDPLGATLEILGLTSQSTGVLPDGWQVARHLFVMPDGRMLGLDSARPYHLHQELDRSYPVGEPTIRSITVGRSCAPDQT